MIIYGRWTSIRREVPVMWLKYGVALVGAILGFVLAWRVIQRERRPSACDDAPLCWDEEPIAAWRQDRTTALFIALHAASVVILGVLFLLEMSAHQDDQTLFLVDTTPFVSAAKRSEFDSSVTTLATGGLGVVWFLCGSLLAFPFARRLVRPMHLAILPNGVVSGPYLWEWRYFSHFSSDPSTRLIRFYSTRTPGIACMAWQPPNAGIFSQAVALLSQHLPSSPPGLPPAWYRRTSVQLALQLLAITIPFVLIGLVLYALGVSWSWMYYTFITPLVGMLGLIVLRRL